MTRIFKLLLSIALCINISASLASIDKKYTPAQYISDIDQLVSTIKQNHPRPFMFINEREFDQLVQSKKEKISSETTYGQFIWDMSEVLAAIGCGHSSFRYYFIQEDKLLPANKRFPMDVRVIGDKLYVIDPLVNSDDVSIGQEILEINGKSSKAILQDIYKHLFADANLMGSKRFNFNVFANSYLAYYFDFTESYSINVDGDDKNVNLDMLSEYKHKPMISPEDSCQDQLCLEFLDEDVAKLTVRSFNYYGKKSRIFEKFIEESFAEVKQKNPESLIIDIRGNGGGNSFSAAYLLAHIADKDFTFYKPYAPGAERLKKPIAPYANAFKGNTYIITDGSDGSSASFFLALAKSYDFASIVGSDSGASFTTNAGYKDHELKNTGVLYRVSTAIMDTNADGLVYGEPIRPDYRSKQSIEDYLIGRDTILEDILELIKQKNTRSLRVEKVIKANAKEFLNESLAHSISVGVYKDGDFFTGHYGELDLGKGNTATDSTIYDIASVTKTFTGILAAQAVVEGKLNLEDDIRKYLNDDYHNFEFEGEPIRIKHLLTHTSGLPANNKPFEEALRVDSDGLLWKRLYDAEFNYSKDRFFQDIKEIKIKAKPGTNFLYSNLGTNMMGLILQNVYRTDFQELVTLHILNKSGMTNSGFKAKDKNSWANGYNPEGVLMPHLPLEDILWGAEGALKSTIPDLLSYIEFNLDIKDPIVRESHSRLHQLDDGYWMGYFWWLINIDIKDGINKESGIKHYRHDGGTAGTRTVLMIFPEQNFGVTLISNTSSPKINKELTKIAWNLFKTLN